MPANGRPGRLAGKRVLITGTGGGQGAAAQRGFCEEGARVVGCDLAAGAAERTADELRAEGFDAWGWTEDLSSPDAAREWVDRGAETLGGLDVLYNNAAATDFAPFDEMTRDIWDFSMRNECPRRRPPARPANALAGLTYPSSSTGYVVCNTYNNALAEVDTLYRTTDGGRVWRALALP